ncbi:MAG: hypothetical protein UY97_C0008G0004 [Parcubacteria group bacterium GW2011_GWB1_57_6]|nr:MAG: hypothetical protein UY93_C0002G0351 [Parcubacteria group bacterium GW2011_GWA1_56_13]KKW46217.1 MAG: hypothetical protein UY97_C0008G0004 [Parcubacteria group bacterium GW2011_GWB1_57_6]
MAASAAIPFFGPIIPQSTNQCAAGWGLIMVVVNNIISFGITLAIVFVAPLMIAYAGFLFVVNPVSAGGKAKAKSILLNTVVGIVVALAGWMIVDAVMAVLYNRAATVPGTTTVLGTWSQLITTGGADICIPLAGSLRPAVAPPPTLVTACPTPSLSAITDPLASQMEAGDAVVWTNTDPRLQSCANQFIGRVGGRVTSAYRPQAYQTHLWEIRDRWCTQGLKTNANAVCQSLKNSVSTEVTKHFGSTWSCGAVGSTSRHTAGTGVDIGGINHASVSVQEAAAASCLDWANYADDPYHYNLRASCSCQ